MNRVFFYVLLVFLLACQNKPSNNNSNKEKSSFETYSSYMNDGVFERDRFIADIIGIWVCYKYEKDTLRRKYPMFEHDEKQAFEMSKYYYLNISNDTLAVNNIFKLPMTSYAMKVDSLEAWGLKSIYTSFYQGVKCKSDMKWVYSIDAENNIRYKEYCEDLMLKGDTVPYYAFIKDPISVSIWCFPETMALYYNGYNYYFKQGEFDSKGITGISSDKNNRFIINKTYVNSTIEQAAYKLIDDFPKGTQGLLIADDEPNEKGEQELFFPETSFEMYTTTYNWKNPNELTVTIDHNRNCTFVFEFVKKGNNVHVKYWNDVIFPFEDGYKGS